MRLNALSVNLSTLLLFSNEDKRPQRGLRCYIFGVTSHDAARRVFPAAFKADWPTKKRLHNLKSRYPVPRPEHDVRIFDTYILCRENTPLESILW